MKSQIVNHFNICTDVGFDSLPTEPTRFPLDCPIYIKVDSYCYPNATWDDFAVRVLCWWLEDIIQLEIGSISRAELLFMDGPYQVHLEPIAHDLRCKVKYFSSQHGGVFEPIEHICSIRQIKEETILTSRRLLLSLQKVNYWDIDCDKLGGLVEKERGR